MADPEKSHFLVPSVLDRLLGASPPSDQQLARNRERLVRDLKESLQRDLQDLLNSRWRCGDIPPGLKELDCSLVRYGIPDLTGANVAASVHRRGFLQVIEDSIERFEPRLKHVRVLAMDDDREPIERVFRFRIEAVLKTDNDTEEIAFVSTMEPATGDFAVDSA